MYLYFNVTWVPKVKQINRESKKKRACAAASMQKQVNQMEDNLDQLRNSLNALNDAYTKQLNWWRSR